MTTTTRRPETDPMFCSPDGEPRTTLFRVGDLFALDPTGHLRSGIADRPSTVRPFGMRFLTPAVFTMGAHEGASKQTSSNSDGTGPEEMESD